MAPRLKVLALTLTSARPGGVDRIHHADLDRDLAARFSRRAHDGWEDSEIVIGIVRRARRRASAAGEINPGQLIALSRAVGFGISVAMMKSLTRHRKTLAIIFCMLVLPFLLPVFSLASLSGLAFGLCLRLDRGDCVMRLSPLRIFASSFMRRTLV